MMTSGDAHGVIFNVDSVLRLGSLRRQLGRLRALRTTSLRDRRSMLAMPRLVRALSADLDSAPVFYLTAFPIVLAKPITASFRVILFITDWIALKRGANMKLLAATVIFLPSSPRVGLKIRSISVRQNG